MAGAYPGDGGGRPTEGRPENGPSAERLAEHLRGVLEEQAEILAAEEIDEGDKDFTFHAQWETPLAVVTVDATFPKEDLPADV